MVPNVVPSALDMNSLSRGMWLRTSIPTRSLLSLRPCGSAGTARWSTRVLRAPKARAKKNAVMFEAGNKEVLKSLKSDLGGSPRALLARFRWLAPSPALMAKLRVICSHLGQKFRGLFSSQDPEFWGVFRASLAQKVSQNSLL